MATRSGVLFLSLWLLGLAGCATRAVLFSHVTEPATVNFRHTPVGTKRCVIRNFRVQEPVSGYGVSAEWDAGTIRAAARQAGITNIYYVDLQTLSVLSGLYRQRALVVYGD